MLAGISRSAWPKPRVPGPGTLGYGVSASADVGSVGVSIRQDASSGHVIQASADVGSVTVTGG